ncbi:MAG: PEP/pyruvate-binding domain-containing protein [Sandaracinaceae bacterium]
MRRAGIVAFGVLLAACGGASDVGRNTGPPLTEGMSLPRIDDLTRWSLLASRPRNHHVAHTEVVKVVIDLRGPAPVTYFAQSRRYESHYDFVVDELQDGDFDDGMDFYEQVYRQEDRPYVVASIVRYADADTWTFELISGDNLSAERLLWLYQHLRERAFFGDALRFRPTSDVHTARAASLDGRLPVTNDDELYGALQYQPVQLGLAYGRLRRIRGPVPRGQLGTEDLVVTDEVPDDLPLVAALITSRFQAPLAHVAVLSANRGTPDMALRGAIDDARLEALEGQLVRLDVGAQDWTIEPAEQAEAEAHWAAHRVDRPPFDPPLDLSRDELLEQCELHRDDVPIAGAKASNMGELCRLDGIVVPAGFVIPFARYMQHLETGGVDDAIAAFLASDARSGDPTEALADLRSRIQSAPVDPGLLRSVRDRIRALAPGGRVRLRSSTNAEDLPGFNGAGLYASQALDAAASDEDLANGLRHIWSSVWNLGAFQEREHYRIAHARVAMAILVQVSIDDAIGNGVAITQNPYDRLREGVLINIQTTGASVTGAHGDQLPEQWLTFTYLPAREPELIARSSLTDGAILSREEVLRITRQLEDIHHAWRDHLSDGSNAVDVELLVRENREVVYVQARPYRVEWQGREEVVGPPM